MVDLSGRGVKQHNRGGGGELKGTGGVARAFGLARLFVVCRTCVFRESMGFQGSVVFEGPTHRTLLNRKQDRDSFLDVRRVLRPADDWPALGDVWSYFSAPHHGRIHPYAPR